MAIPEGKRLAYMKSILVRAWRERWSDSQWSVHTKPGVVEDVDKSLLADLLLQQATVGISGNHLILSYFRHAVNTQLISFTVGIESLARLEEVNKVYCVKALVEVAHTLIPNIGLKGNFEDSWSLSGASLSLLRWFVLITLRCLQKLGEELGTGGSSAGGSGLVGAGSSQVAEYVTVIQKTVAALRDIASNGAVCALLHLTIKEQDYVLKDIKNDVGSIRDIWGKLQCSQLSSTNVLEALQFVDQLENISTCTQPIVEHHHNMLNPCINVLVHYEATINTTNEIPAIADQLLTAEKLQGLERADMYCEVLRSCFMGLVNSVSQPEEHRWAAFVFLKLPQVLLHIMRSEKKGSEDTELAIYKLLQFSPLLNLADTKCRVECLQILMTEFVKHSLLLESSHERFLTRRKQDSAKAIKSDQQPTQQPIAGLIIRAEPTVTSILKTLDADYSNNKEGLFGVLGHMITLKSFELILTAAAATGKLFRFTNELIKFNEFARTSSGEGGREANIRALLFDMSFLMLCHIAQTYGMQIFQGQNIGDRPSEDVFFVQWATRSLPEETHYKALQLLPVAEEAKVDSLLRQLKAGSAELKTSLTKWNEIFQNAPYAAREILYAWEYGALTQDQVQSYLTTLRSRLCSLSVVSAAYLCSYIQSVDQELRHKPIAMLETLIQPLSPPPDSQQFNNGYYVERSNVMQVVVSKMIQNLLPADSAYRKPASHVLPSTEPATDRLLQTWRQMFNRGCINHMDFMKFEHLLNIGGPQWFCHTIIKETLTKDRPEDLYKGMGFMYALFNLDLPALTLSLLHYTVPSLLSCGGSRLKLITGPRGVVLAKLCIMLIVLNQSMSKHRDNISNKKGRKRTRTELDLEDFGSESDFEMRPSKMRKTDSSQCHTGSFTSADSFLLDDDDSGQSVKDPLSLAVGNLFRIFHSIVQGEELSQRRSFVQHFIEQTIKCEPATLSFIAQFIPPSMVSELLHALPSQFDFNVILAMSSLTNTQGRRVAAKVICQNERRKKVLESQSSNDKTRTDTNAVSGSSTSAANPGMELC